MATSADEKKWNSICTEVRTTITIATPDEKEKLRIATQKVNVGSYVQEKNGRFNVKIRGFGKHRNIGTFPNEEDATLAYAITKNRVQASQGRQKRGKRGPYQKTAAQKLKELLPQPKRKNRKTEAQKLKESVRVNSTQQKIPGSVKK